MTEKTYPFWSVNPHIFILGAGASKAAFPNGDANGRKLPLMADFVETLNLEHILKRYNVEVESNNIEDIYDGIFADNPEAEILQEINDKIFNYFAILRIPEEVTLYDKLLLSLQSKDAIFSFNWDPLLLQAYNRNVSVRELPKIFFLHGNVAIGICRKDKRVGHLRNRCSICGEPFEPSKLLYPIRKKDYNNDSFISGEWLQLEEYLKNAFILTIFGYSAPKPDVAAIEMMRKAWTKNERFNLNEIEIIDILPRETLEENWSDFKHKTHYTIFDNVEDSFSFVYARRSCNHWGDAMFMLKPWSERKIPDFKRLDDLQEWISPLVEEELDFKDNDTTIPRYITKKNKR